MVENYTARIYELFKGDNGEVSTKEIYKVERKEKVKDQGGTKMFFNMLDSLKDDKSLLEAIGFGEGYSIADYGIERFYGSTVDGSLDSIKAVKATRDIHRGGYSIGREINKEPFVQKQLLIRHGEEIIETNRYFGAIVLREGFIINLGTVESNDMFTGPYTSYLSKITQKKLYNSLVLGAKVFKSQKDLEKHLVKYAYQFDCFAFLGSNMSVEEIKLGETTEANNCSEKVSEIMVGLAERYQAYLSKTKEKAKILEATLKGTATDEEMVEEALARFETMSIYAPTVDKYKKGVIMMSEFKGILYDLNEGAKKALEEVRKIHLDDFMPYHIVRTQTSLGDLYSVLGVSKSKEEWIYERWTRENDCININCYNAEQDFVRCGDIRIQLASGGIERIG